MADPMNALTRAFQHTARLFGPDRALWRPFLVTLLVEFLLLLVLWLAPHPPLSGLLAPPVKFLFGGRVLHYPWHPLFIFHVTRYTHDLATLIIGAYMTGIACAMVRQIYEGGPPSASAARHGGQARYGRLVLTWFSTWLLARASVGGIVFLVNHPSAQRWVGVGSVVVLQALFVYAIPAAVFTGAPWWKALSQGMRETVRRPLSTLAVVIPPLALIIGFSIVVSPSRVDGWTLDRMPELALAFASARLLVWTAADALMTVAIAHLWWTHRAPASIASAAAAGPAARSKRPFWPALALALAACVALGVIAPARNRTYAGERLLWKAHRMAGAMPSAADATPEQIDRMRGALREVVKTAPGTRPAIQSLLALGALGASQRDFAGAREAYEQVLASSAGWPEMDLAARMMIAKTYGLQDDWTEAARVYQEIGERYPWTPPGMAAPISAAVMLEEHGRKDEAAKALKSAIQHYRDAVRLAPSKELETTARKYLDEARRRAGENTDTDAGKP